MPRLGYLGLGIVLGVGVGVGVGVVVGLGLGLGSGLESPQLTEERRPVVRLEGLAAHVPVRVRGQA